MPKFLVDYSLKAKGRVWVTAADETAARELVAKRLPYDRLGYYATEAKVRVEGTAEAAQPGVTR